LEQLSKTNLSSETHEQPSSTPNSDIITPKVIKTVIKSVISRNKDQNAATIQTKTNDSIQENPHEQNVKKNSATIKHTLMPQRKDHKQKLTQLPQITL